ncbi:MAG: glycine cleavage T C-terminal barrel domain-containing protein, partial [Pseudomonadota bacterium]|nr:glycine cleavage T C-terminal barrel domain-containing protein [Pseudomonadota bacterium]
DDRNAVQLGNEPVLQEDCIIGKTTPAAFGYRIGRPVLLAMLDHACCVDGQSVSDYIAGVRFNGQVKCGAAYDQKGRRMRNAV